MNTKLTKSVIKAFILYFSLVFWIFIEKLNVQKNCFVWDPQSLFSVFGFFFAKLQFLIIRKGFCWWLWFSVYWMILSAIMFVVYLHTCWAAFPFHLVASASCIHQRKRIHWLDLEASKKFDDSKLNSLKTTLPTSRISLRGSWVDPNQKRQWIRCAYQINAHKKFPRFLFEKLFFNDG